MKALLAILFLVFSISLQAQKEEKKRTPVKILNADLLDFEDGVRPVRKLIGNVRLKQDDVIMDCDSAYFYTEGNDISAYSNVHIKQGDSLDIFADSLKYIGETKIATLYRNVKLIKDGLKLSTDLLIYDLNRKVAMYYNGAEIITDDTKLTSKTGYYYEQSQIAYFKDDVKLKNPSYSLTADTLKYNVPLDISYFLGPTDIISDSAIIYCEGGWFNGQTEKAFFKKNARFVQQAQKVTADSIYFEQESGKGKAYSNVVWEDTAEHTIIYCGFADYDRKSETMLATITPVLVSISDSDSLFIAADTLWSLSDSMIAKRPILKDTSKLDSGKIVHETDSQQRDSTYTKFIRVLHAYHNVRIYRGSMQGMSDSLYYSEDDSLFKMFQDPILWVDESQMTGDTIFIHLKNDELNRLDLMQNAFIISESDSGMYNQIKGSLIYGHFRDDSLYKMEVLGNGESLYYALDDSDAYIGLNEAACSKMNIYFKDEQVDKISFLDNPDATFHPVQNIKIEEQILEDFNWQIGRKPKSSAELFKPHPALVQAKKDAAKIEDMILKPPSDLESPLEEAAKKE